MNNSELVQNFQILRDYYAKKRDRFRSAAYARAVRALSRLPEIKTTEDVKGIKGIGKTLTAKIEEYLSTGKINKVESIKDEVNDVHPFEKIFGVGPKTSYRLQSMGFRTISDLKSNTHVLTNQQKTGLKYYYELLEKIPRIKITALSIIIKYLIDKTFGRDTYQMDVAGSYRRGKPFSGDIDILITSEYFTLEQLVSMLTRYDIITDTLSMRNTKFMGIAKCPGQKRPHYRLDIEFLPREEYFSGLLYFTGSKELNVEMRLIAKNKGYLLNEHGLFRNGRRLPIDSERDIFDKLEIEYLMPTDR